MKAFSYLIRLLWILAIAESYGGVETAGLTWDNTAKTFTLHNGQRTTEVAFDYKNTTSSEIVIKKISPDCSCTLVGDHATRIMPQQSGSLKFNYEFGDRTGKFQRSIKIETNNGTTELSFSGEIVEWVTVSPRLLVWQSDLPNETKSFQVVFSPGVKAEVAPPMIDGVEATVNQISAQLVEITVRPRDLTRKNISLPIRIDRVDMPIIAVKSAFVVIR